MLRRLLLIAPLALLAGQAFAKDAIDASRAPAKQPLLLEVNKQTGEYRVYASESLNPATVAALNATKGTAQADKFTAIIKDTATASNEVTSDVKLAVDKAALKDEVSGKTAWWYASYGWSFSYSYSYSYYNYYYTPVYYYRPVTYYYYPTYTYYYYNPGYTYWIIG